MDGTQVVLIIVGQFISTIVGATIGLLGMRHVQKQQAHKTDFTLKQKIVRALVNYGRNIDSETPVTEQEYQDIIIDALIVFQDDKKVVKAILDYELRKKLKQENRIHNDLSNVVRCMFKSMGINLSVKRDQFSIESVSPF